MVYLIKVNRDEIMRISKPDDDDDVQRSCLCRFVVITADGCLHLIEIIQEPSASVLNSGLKALRKFPKDVFCFDCYSEVHCLLLLVVLLVSRNRLVENLLDCLIVLLNFWLKLTEEMQEIALNKSSVGTLRFDPVFFTSCLKVLTRLVMEESISPSQAWGTVICYASSGLIGYFAVEIPIFCRAMLYSVCGFGAISEVFLEAMSKCAISLASTAKNEFLDLPQLYVNMLELILRYLVGGSHEHQNLYHLLSSLSKLEGQIEDLQRVRHVVWDRLAQFSDNLELPSHVRVYVLEIMQLITGRNIKGFPTQLESNVLPWEGWDGMLSTSDPSASQGLPDHTDTLHWLPSNHLSSHQPYPSV